jgi:hypothetical protein
VRAARSRRLVLAGVSVAALLTAGLSAVGEAPRAVVVRDAAGEVIAREALRGGGEFALAYRHSYYGAPAREVFTAEPSGFALRELVSPSAAVLDYYSLDGRRTRSGRWIRLSLRDRRRYERLPLIATSTGRRTLVVGDRRVPLYGAAARHLTMTVEGGS